MFEEDDLSPVERAVGYQLAGEVDLATAAYEAILGEHPDDFLALHMFGVLKLNTEDAAGAETLLRRAVAVNPDVGSAQCNLGVALFRSGRPGEALAHYGRALSLQPDLAEAWGNAAQALSALGRAHDAIEHYTRALALRPDWPEILQARAFAASAAGDRDLALADCERCLALGPNQTVAGMLYGFHSERASWDKAASLQLEDEAALGWSLGIPMFTADPARQLRMAKICAAHFGQAGKPLAPRAREGGKIRLAYVSADFRNHPVATMIYPLIRAHDRERFEVIGVSIAGAEPSQERNRIRSAFDEMLDVDALSDASAAAVLRDRGVDIAIDLMGYSAHSRPGILAQRAAPIQINFMGYPASSGAPWLDYIVGDPFVIPLGEEKHFSEQVLRLPHCYLPTNPWLDMEDAPTRESERLPEGAFVFASFNQIWKLTPAMFDVWAAILRGVENSILWLPKGNGLEVENNLRSAAERRGVAGDRLVFAARAPLHGAHLARYSLVNLCLDPWPFNGHTTTADALLSGAPVLTRRGSTFASRVAGSMLNVAGLSELIADTPESYVSCAVALAHDRQRLSDLRAKCEEALSSPLFDVDRYTRDFEALLQSVGR